ARQAPQRGAQPLVLALGGGDILLKAGADAGPQPPGVVRQTPAGLPHASPSAPRRMRELRPRQSSTAPAQPRVGVIREHARDSRTEPEPAEKTDDAAVLAHPRSPTGQPQPSHRDLLLEN